LLKNCEDFIIDKIDEDEDEDEDDFEDSKV